MTGAGEAQSRSAFRTDIQGLRALAVSLVLVFHLWPNVLTGGYVGVDVFLVISGYLITLHLIEHPPRSGRDLLEFWARRIRRLLPAAFVVLGATTVASRLLLPSTQWGEVAKEVIASATYVENWLLAGNAVDYLAAENRPTALQHFWSLAVEEQFYLVWPVLVLVVAAVAARRWRTIIIARIAMLAVVAGSFAISVVATAQAPASAYFITPTRVWELGVGGVLATLVGRRTHPRMSPVAAVVCWTGVAAILVSASTFSSSTRFPGASAALPVLGTAAVIGAFANHALSPARILALRPVQILGDLSYSVYLWHWPLIVIVATVVGPLDVLQSAAIVIATVVLAAATKRFVEDGVRYSPRVRDLRPAYSLAAIGMAVVIGLAGLQLAELDSRAAAARAELERAQAGASSPSGAPGSGEPASCFGAEAIARGFAACPLDPAGPMIPAPELAKDDKSDAYADKCWTNQPFTERRTCSYGTGAVRVALVGNSHAGQWLPALQRLAEERGWTITTFLISQCNATDAPLHFDNPAAIDNCRAWGRWVEEQTRGSAFDVIITAEKQSVSLADVSLEGSQQLAVAGYASYLQRWAEEAAARIVVIRDTPNPGATTHSVPDCLAQNATHQDACGGTSESWYLTDPLAEAARQVHLASVGTVDMTPYFCADGRCPAVIGSVVVYFDASHITATYARSLAPYLGERIGK